MSEMENLIELPENEEFLVHSRSSIASILRNLMREKRTLSAYLHTGDMAATAILHVDPDKNMVILESALDPRVNRIFSDTRNVLFDLKHNSIILQFVARQTQPARFNGQPAVFIEIPDKVLRLQRREFFRIAAISGDSVTCVLKNSGGLGTTVEVEDLSLGGLGAILTDLDLPLQQFQVLNACELRIPGFGTLQLQLQVRNCFEKTLPSGQKVRRLGLAYVDLPSDKESLLQRYVNKQQLMTRRGDDDL